VAGARYATPTTNKLQPLGTFPTKSDADKALTRALASQQRGEWVSLDRGRVTLAEYAPKCIEGRVLRPRTREGYESNLKLHILPVLGEIELRKLNTSVVRQWHAELIESKSRDKAAKCYRLLRSILATAVEDRLIASNPAAIKKAGIERHPERPIATVAEVLALAAAIEPEWRAVVLLGAFASLRVGEVQGLQRRHLDLLHRRVMVERQIQEVSGRAQVLPPKSDAGRRRVAVPEAIVADLESHLATWAAPGPDGLLVPSSTGGPFRKSPASWEHDGCICRSETLQREI
jgi:integrase